MQNKRGQLFGLPFGIIFSIILIVFFMISAWIAISVFWSPTKCAFSDTAQEGLFVSDLKDAVRDVWNSQGAERKFKIILPGKIDKICFFDYSKNGKGKNAEYSDELKRFGNGNLYLYPVKKACQEFRVINLEHIDIGKITEKNNPYCIDNGKNVTLKKGFNENLVLII